MDVETTRSFFCMEVTCLRFTLQTGARRESTLTSQRRRLYFSTAAKPINFIRSKDHAMYSMQA